MRKSAQFLRVMAFAITFFVGSLQVATAKIIIVPQVSGTPDVQLELKRMIEFSKSVTLSVRTDPRLVPPKRVLELVKSLDIRDGAGIKIERGYAIDAQHDLVIGWSGGSTEISKVQQTPSGLVVAGLFKDHTGKIVVPPVDRLAAYTTAGKALCFERASIEAEPQTLPMSFVILMDRSGSMSEVMDDVRRSALAFIDSLPTTAICSVGAFAKTVSFDPKEGLGTNFCQPQHFNLAKMQVGGSTNLFPALSQSYQWLNHPSRKTHQKAVIVLTDGAVTDNKTMGTKVLTDKGGAPTFVYFLGDREDKWLKGIADNYLQHAGDVSDQLGQYFDVVSEAYRKQTVLKLRECPAQAAKP
ncbi:vWA domain-containing protein [Roseibium sp. AS2]|uniref:vWA domain-containing protein n=1 Tax=Roseibium sp. AS2 TaxID=3135781 RepID=UPI00316FCF88